MTDVLAVLTAAGQPVGTVERSALEFASRLATAGEGAWDVLVLGSGAAEAGADLCRAGARRVFTLEHDDLEQPTAEALSAALERCLADSELLGGVRHRVIAAATTSRTREFLPRVAARCGIAMASDAVGLEVVDDSEIRVTRSLYCGGVLASVALTGERVIATCRVSEFEPLVDGDQETAVESVRLEGPLAHPRKRFVRSQASESARPDLKDADTVVSVGRGVRGPDEGIALCGELADVLGAALGATRAVVDAGWLPNELQVGQTGKVVAPKVYIAVGLSGAIQHLAGMRGARTIVAINSDADAPIFEVADLGLVADLFEAVPELTRLLRERAEG